MTIAYTMASGPGDTDLLLYQLAGQLRDRGHSLCGTVQINTERRTGPCHMDVSVLPGGPTFRISQNLGSAAKGCRLDPMALEAAVGLVGASLRPDTDLLIVNKFGKHEAEGRGFRSVVADALSLDIPILVGINALNLAAFQDFVGEEVTALDPNLASLSRWFDGVLASRMASPAA